MNKKITPQIIRIIALQSILVIIAVSAIGGAVMVHGSFKSGGKTPVDKPSTTESATESVPVQTTEPATERVINEDDYPYGYAGFCPQETKIYKDDYSKIIINGDYCLPAGYKPELEEAVKGSGVMLDSGVAPYYQAMYDAAKKDGILLNPVSGYRSLERQTNNFERKIQELMDQGMDKKEATIEAATVIMVPGSSEHNAGLAMDICSLAESFENTDEFKWLQEHAAEYGFIMRYPKEEAKRKITKVIYEPWHYRYVGQKAAMEITSRGITLEEYLGLA